LTLLLQYNLLISQGHCAALGCPVPSPFFLQELLLGPYVVNLEDADINASTFKIFSGAEISENDLAFYRHFLGNRLINWWEADPSVGNVPHFDELSEIFKDEFEMVHFLFVQVTHC
jgi:hypothetical protein